VSSHFVHLSFVASGALSIIQRKERHSLINDDLQFLFQIFQALTPHRKHRLHCKYRTINADIVIGIATSHGLGFNSRQIQKMCFCFKTSTQALKPNQPSIQRVTRFFPGSKVAEGWRWPLTSTYCMSWTWTTTLSYRTYKCSVDKNIQSLNAKAGGAFS
jgi:hypothetical protein